MVRLQRSLEPLVALPLPFHPLILHHRLYAQRAARRRPGEICVRSKGIPPPPAVRGSRRSPYRLSSMKQQHQPLLMKGGTSQRTVPCFLYACPGHSSLKWTAQGWIKDGGMKLNSTELDLISCLSQIVDFSLASLQKGEYVRSPTMRDYHAV